MKIPASRRKRADATIGEIGSIIEICPCSSPYLWIGEKGKRFDCYGIIKGDQVKKLRDMCNEILDRRELEKLKRK